MWEERTSWNVSWSGTTIWGYDYRDSKYFDDEQSALEFCVKLGLNDGVDYIHLLFGEKRNRRCQSLKYFRCLTSK